MIRFWDSSGIVSLVVRQRHTRAAEALLADGAGIAVWWATPVECSSALARLMRERALDSKGGENASRRLQEISDYWIEIEPSTSLRELAQAMVTRYPIKAADGLQLAAARIFADPAAPPIDFVTFDERLGMAAQREGFRACGASREDVDQIG